MIVVSQDRCSMVKIENVELVQIQNNTINAFFHSFSVNPYSPDNINEKCITLGYYKSNEEAQIVLKDMAHALANFNNVFSMPLTFESN